jgi:hypothetical protein
MYYINKDGNQSNAAMKMGHWGSICIIQLLFCKFLSFLELSTVRIIWCSILVGFNYLIRSVLSL